MVRRMKSSKIFITGCDSNTEWMLDWFVMNYLKHNSNQLYIMDFGMSERALEKHAGFVLPLPPSNHVGWFHKPLAMLSAARLADKVCWLDTDCQVLGDISGIFDYVEKNKLAMVEDLPWSTRRGSKWHNSGVVAFEGVPAILTEWHAAVVKSPQVGDQEVLHALLNTPMRRFVHIVDVPNKYNVLRVQWDKDDSVPKDVLIKHYTGAKGKLQIWDQMNG
jgi:hypothetical protein